MKKLLWRNIHRASYSAAKRMTSFSIAFCLMFQCLLVTSAGADSMEQVLTAPVTEIEVNTSAEPQAIKSDAKISEQVIELSSENAVSDTNLSQDIDEQNFWEKYTLILPEEDSYPNSSYAMLSGSSRISTMSTDTVSTVSDATASAIDISDDVKYAYHFLDSVSLNKVLRSDAVKYEAENYTAIAPSEPGRKVRTVNDVDYDVIWLQGDTAEAVATYEVTVETAGTYELIISGTGVRNEETPSPRGISWWLDGGQKYQVDIEPIISTAYTYNNDPIAGFAMGYVYGITLELEAGVNVLHFGHHEEYGKLGRINFDAFYIQKASSSFPTYADFEYGYLADSSTGEVAACAIMGYTGNAASINIPATIKGYPVIYIYSNAFANNTNIQTVQLSSNITLIASNAFAGCKNLTACYITSAPNLDAIGAYAFYGCSSLQNIVLPNKVTVIGKSTFRYCSALKSINLPNSLKEINASAFRNCTGLESIVIPSSLSTLGGYIFADCTGLVSAELTEGLYVTGYGIFDGCTALTTVTLPSTLETINELAFNECSSLTEIVIPDTVTKIDRGAFQLCTSLTDVSLPDSLTEIKDYTFNYCHALASTEISSNVTRIGYAGFARCYSLTAVTIPASVTELGDFAFYECTKLESAYFLGDAPTTVGEYIFDLAEDGFTIYFNANASGWTTPTWTTSTSTYNTEIDEELAAIGDFEYSISNGEITITKYKGMATSLKIPANIGNFPVTKIGSIFDYNSWRIESIFIPASVIFISSLDNLGAEITVDINNENYTSIDGVLFDKNINTLIKYPNRRTDTSYTIPDSVVCIGTRAFTNGHFNQITIPDSVVTIENRAFEACSELTSIHIPASVSYIGQNAFDHCTSLIDITVDTNNKNYTSIDGVLFDKNVSTLIKYPSCRTDTSYTVPDSVTCIKSDAINLVYFLTQITIPYSVVSIEHYALPYSDPNITAIVVNPNNQHYQSISGILFNKTGSELLLYPSGKDDIASYTIPSSVTHIEHMYACGISTLYIPASVVSLGSQICSYSWNLTKAYFYGNVPTNWGFSSFSPCHQDFTIYYPEGNTSGWTSPTWTAPDGTVYNTATFKPGSSSDPTMPPTDPDFTPSVEYDEEVVLPTQFPINQTDDYLVMVIDAVTKEPIADAVVGFDEQVSHTAENGFATFTVPAEDDSVILTIAADGYNGFTIDEYFDFERGNFDAFELYPSGYAAITPISCNNISINTSVAMINNQADLTAVIKVKGIAVEAITKYCLVQNDNILAESTTGTFSVSNKSFAKDVPVSAWMYTADGKITKQILKINVISVGFNLNLNLDNDSLSVTIPESVPLWGNETITASLPETNCTVDISNDTIKVGYNFEVAKKDLSKLNSGLRKWMDEHHRKTPYANFQFDMAGYVVVRLGNTGVKDVVGEICLTVNYKNGFDKTYWVPVLAVTIPIRVEVEMAVGGTLSIKNFGYDFENATWILPDADMLLSGELTARAGVGVCFASAGIYGKLGTKLFFDVFPEFDLNYIHATGNIGVYLKAKLGFIEADYQHPLIGTKDGEPLVIYSKDSATTMSALSDEFNPYEVSIYGLMAREVLSAQSSWNSSVTDGVLQLNAYQNADPQIITTDANTMMVYLDDNGGGDAYNFQRLVYSVWNGSGWNAPAPVDNNELVDADFCAYTDGTNIWIAYTQANRLFTEADANEDYASAMEIALVCYDFQTAAFSSPSILTANDTYDMQPQITVVNGIPTVVWSNNSDNHILGMTNQNSLYVSQYTQEQWCAPVCIAENVSAMYDLKIGAFDSLGYVVAAIHDLDNDFNTDSDSCITLYHQDGSRYMYTADYCSNLVFNQQTLYWFQNNSIYSVSGYREEAMTIYEFEAISIVNDFDMIYQDGLTYLFYRVYNSNGENGGSTLYTVAWDGETWTAPVELTENSGYIDSFDVQIINDSLLLVYRRTDVSFANANLAMQCELRSNMLAFVPSVVITDISYDSEDLFDDDKITLTVSVTNNGLRAANGIQLMDENNTLVSYAVQISSGETINLSFDYMIPPDVQESSLSIINEKGVTACHTFDVGFADFVVSANSKVIVKTSYVNVSIANRGNTSSNGTLNVYQENSSGKLLYSETLELDANKQKNVLLEILDNTLAEVYVEFLSNTQEYNSHDNSTYCPVVQWQGATISGIIYWNDNETNATIDLLQNGEKKYSAETSINAKSGETTQFFTFSNVLPGTYTLCIEKNGYLPYTISNISVTATDNINLSQHINSAIAQIRPFYGNINQDDAIDMSDIAEIRSNKNYGLAIGEVGVNQLCDLNNDGICNLMDIAVLRQSDSYGKTKEDCVFSYTESMVP